MSRRPTQQMGKSGLPRATSTASIAMPPPKTTQRATSVLSTSTASNVIVNHDGGAAGEPSSRGSVNGTPRKTGVRKTMGGGKTESGEINIQVVVRCRGRSSIELASSSPIITTTSGPLSKNITVETTPMTSSSLASFTTASSYGAGGPTTKTYPFDKVFGPEADQAMVFNEVAEPMLDEVLSGYNCTIFAYGQTGTGKTYTMQGDLELSPLLAPLDSAGIVPRVLHRLFTLLENGGYTEYSVKCSYVELYNEELRDLLSTEYSPASAADRQPMSMNQGGTVGGLKLYEDGKKGVMIQGLEETGVRNLKEALNLVNKGCQRRQVAETKMNTESSRSHTIFSITVHVKETSLISGGEDLLRIGKFNLVDLAGSEAIGRSGATDKRAREAGMINQSLLTLGRVISALVEKGSHIPYRESKLTRLLQDSLGGRTKTCIVATVSPTRSNMEETLSTLDYAIRAKSIRNRPEINAHMTKTGLLKEYIGDIEKLKAEVLAAREKNGIYIPEDQWREMHEAQVKQKSDYEEAKLRANAATVELATKKKDFEELINKFIVTSEELERTKEAERQLGVLIEEVKVQLEGVRIELDEEKVVAEAYILGEERLDGVAGGLRDLAKESVADVGGLFEKLARKAKVLGANTDAATGFGSDLQQLSTELREGLAQLQSVQQSSGSELQSTLESYREQHRQQSQVDLDGLQASFSAFNDLSKSLSRYIDQGKTDVSETSSAIRRISHDVHSSVKTWAADVQDRSGKMVEVLLQKQQEQLAVVGTALESTADLVDSVISTARDHITQEEAAHAKAKDLATQTANAEISRLRAQNALLAKLLSEEKSKTAKLRTSLINNLTSLIVDFTETQDQSWSEVVQKVQAENNTGVEAMESWVSRSEEVYAESSTRAGEMRGTLEIATENGLSHRQKGVTVLDGFREEMTTSLEEYGRQTGEMAIQQAGVVDGFCQKLSGTAKEASGRAEKRAVKQAEKVSLISKNVSEGLEASKARIATTSEQAETISTSLLDSHATTSATYAESHSATSSKLDSILSTTAEFLTNGILEDVPTGVTPRKRAWNIPSEWERVQPRAALIEAFRNRGNNQNDRSTTAMSSSERSSQAGPSQPPSRTTSPTIALTSEQIGSMKSLQSDNIPIHNHNHNHNPHQNPLSMSTGLRVPKPRMVSNGSSNIGILGGKKSIVPPGAMVEERPQIAVLGEGGVNVPRRATRKG